ncbi:MAG: hypothetical protein WA738_20955 [Candidatus Angelobacter sp.]
MSQEKIGYKIQQLSFRSGESAPISGIWHLEHASCTNASDLWVRRQDAFPACPKCGSATNFILVEEVEHISEDSDFR